MPRGDGFGTPSPNAGFAITIVRRADLEDKSPEFEAVVAAIMVARASSFGRAPTEGDLKAALAMCGVGGDFPEWVHERREHWKHAIAHDKPPGRTAVTELDRELLLESPDRIRSIFKLRP